MGMQGLGMEGGTTLQMHRTSLSWLRALWCALYDQYRHAGIISWHRHSCTGKTTIQCGDTRTAVLKEMPKHVIGLLPECWHCRQKSDAEDNYLHLSLNHRHSLHIHLSFWEVLDILSTAVLAQELWGWRTYISNTGTVILRFFYRFHTWHESNTRWSLLWCYYFAFMIQADEPVQSMNYCNPPVDILLPIVLILKLWCCSVAVFLSSILAHH